MNLLQLFGLVSLIYVIQAASYADLLADLQFLYNVEPSKPDYYADDPYMSKDANDWGLMYPDVIDEPAPKQARDYGEAVIRDQEYMKQLPISGYHFISGGTGRDEEPTEVKTDKVLPAYCNPPNPCPIGYTEEDDCLTNFENTPENNQRLQEQETCSCDTEHMLSCPDAQNTIDPKSADFGSDGTASDDMQNIDSLVNMNLSDNPYLSTGKRHRQIAKKSPLFIQKRSADKERLEDLFTLEELARGAHPKRVAAKKAAPRTQDKINM